MNMDWLQDPPPGVIALSDHQLRIFGGRGAWYGDGGRDSAYRYLLWDIQDPDKPIACWICLNPSTATELKNDPTVERISRRTFAAGQGGFLLVNLFAYRATSPQDMKRQEDPEGILNQFVVTIAAKMADEVVVAWGNHGNHRGLGQRTLGSLRFFGIKPKWLGATTSGEPLHPLMVPYRVTPYHPASVSDSMRDPWHEEADYDCPGCPPEASYGPGRAICMSCAPDCQCNSCLGGCE